MLLSVPEISSRIYLLLCFGRLVCCSALSLCLYASPDLCCVPVAPLGGWLFGPPHLSAFVASWQITASLVPRAGFLAPTWTIQCERSSFCPPTILHGRFSVPLPPLLLVLDYSLLFMVISFAGGCFSLLRDCAGLFSQHGVGCGDW
jgi:hypothetical protein